MANTYTALHYHIVFSTKDRLPLIQPDFQERVWSYLGGIARENGLQSLRVGGTPDHVHIALTAPPTIAVSTIVKKIKGGSSGWIKDLLREETFSWQDGYGAFTVSRSNLNALITYIDSQPSHHATRTFQDEYLAFLRKHGVDFDPKYVFA